MMPSIPGPRVLVVTEDAELAETIRATVAQQRCDVDTVRHAAEALERFAEHHYDLLIASLRLRDLDGPGLYWAVRAQWPLGYPRVIFLVREGEHLPQSARGLSGPEAPVLHVPFPPESLRELVRRALGLR